MTATRFPPCTPTLRWCRHGGPCCGYPELSGLADEEAMEHSGDAYRWIPGEPVERTDASGVLDAS
jgi:hypothetical protein